MRQAREILNSDPQLAFALFERANAAPTTSSSALHSAWSTLVSNQIAWNKGNVQVGQVSALHEAARVFYANEHYDEAVTALALRAQLAYCQGDIPVSVRSSMQGFRELRASPGCRLLAARAVMWAIPEGESTISDELLGEIRSLARTAPSSFGKVVATTYLAYRDFKRILFQAGLPTDTDPYPPKAVLTALQARDAVKELLKPLEQDRQSIRTSLPADPVPMLFLAALHGFVDGSSACIRVATEVAMKCDAGATPYIHAVVGVAHLRHHEYDQAIQHLEQCLDHFQRRGRSDEGRPWVFYLSLALRGTGRFQDALVMMDRFLASGQKVQQPWRSTATALRELQDQLKVEVYKPKNSVQLVSSRPPYIKLAIQWMLDHLQQPIRVPEIARAAGVSRRTLEIGFKEYRQRTVAEDLRWMRMQRALMLLRAANAELSDVRAQIGYQSPAKFSRDFRKVFGVPPSKSSQLHSEANQVLSD